MSRDELLPTRAKDAIIALSFLQRAEKNGDAFFKLEDVKLTIADLSAELAKVGEALTDLMDGQNEHDVVCQTGLSLARCREICEISAKYVRQSNEGHQ